MKKLWMPLLFAVVSGSVSVAVMAKLPAPVLTDEAKAKAAEAAAKTAWSAKTEGYLLCKYQDKAAASFFKTAASSGKTPKPAMALPACAEVGAFVYPPVAAATPATPAAPVAATPAAGAATKAAPVAPVVAPAKKS